MSDRVPSLPAPPLNPNGPGAAALLAAGIAAFLLPVLAIASDHLAAIKRTMNFYAPTGPLSGVTTTTVVLWLTLWLVLHWMWHRRMVVLKPIGIAAFLLLVLGFLLTFPPIADLF